MAKTSPSAHRSRNVASRPALESSEAALSDLTYDPASHYDRVTKAWGLLLGNDLHYGVFDIGPEDLPTATAALTARMIDAGAITSGVSVLDVGCGTGAPACHLGRLGATVTGITTSEVGVAEARARANAESIADRVRFEERDGMDNGFPDASFERVWVLESSHLMREKQQLIAECARVLQPGGRMALCDIVLRREMPFEEVRRLLKPLALLRAVFGDAHMESLDTYAQRCVENGLVVDRRDDLTDATRPTFDRWRDNAHEHREAVVQSVGVDEWQRFVDSCDVLAGFWEDGTLGYGLIAAAKS
jgi:cyclopropane fatty-acyl-phospholipid synthase-like methyltransferase